MFRAGTYVIGISSVSSATESCLGTSMSEVRADPPKTRRSISTHDVARYSSRLATARAASNSTACRWP